MTPLLVASALAACQPTADDSPPPRRASSAGPTTASAVYFGSATTEVAGWTTEPDRLLANRWSGSRSTALELVPSTEERPRPTELSRPDEDCLVLRAFAAGPRRLLSCPAPGARERRELVVLEAGGRRVPLVAPPQRFWKLLTPSNDGRALWLAETGGERPPRVVVTEAPSWRARPLFEALAGYEIVDFAPATSSVLLRRSLSPEADEVVRLDGRSGERRLLLPDGEDGRFRSLRWIDNGRRILLLADDGTDVPRLEVLDPESGRRSTFGPPAECPVLSASVGPGGLVTRVTSCAGRLRADLLSAEGVPVELPPLAEGLRAIDVVPSPDGERLGVTTVGERWPRDVAWFDPRGDYRPLSYSLAAQLAPDRLPIGERVQDSVDALTLPAEIWQPSAGRARAGVIWFESDDSQPHFGEHWPVGADLAAHGVAVLRVRGRGAGSPSRRQRRAADGAPERSALADFLSAASELVRRTRAALPLYLVAEGDWRGAAALALATRTDAPYAALVALDPALDPLAETDTIGSAAEPLRSFQLARWGTDFVSRLDAGVRADWRFPVDRLRHPTTVFLDAADPATGERIARCQSARAAGVQVSVRALRWSDDEHRFAAAEPQIVTAILDSLATHAR